MKHLKGFGQGLDFSMDRATMTINTSEDSLNDLRTATYEQVADFNRDSCETSRYNYRQGMNAGEMCCGIGMVLSGIIYIGHALFSANKENKKLR